MLPYSPPPWPGWMEPPSLPWAYTSLWPAAAQRVSSGPSLAVGPSWTPHKCLLNEGEKGPRKEGWRRGTVAGRPCRVG